MSMAWNALDPLRDEQERPPVGECARCGDLLPETEAVLDEFGHIYCPECNYELTRRKNRESVRD